MLEEPLKEGSSYISRRLHEQVKSGLYGLTAFQDHDAVQMERDRLACRLAQRVSSVVPWRSGRWRARPRANARLGGPLAAKELGAVVVLRQAFEGLSHGEAWDQLEADLRWQAVVGVDAGYRPFRPTLLVG